MYRTIALVIALYSPLAIKRFNAVYYARRALTFNPAPSITSNLPHALAGGQRGFPEAPARPSEFPSSTNRDGTTDRGSRLTAHHLRWTKPQGHENSPDRGQVEEG